MDLVHILRVLWARRGWVLASVALAAVVSIAIGFRVTTSPLSVAERSARYGIATTKVLVDTVPSTLADSGSDYEPLVTRAGVFAQLFSTAALRESVARSSGIPSADIVTDVPSNGLQVTGQPAPDRPTGGVGRSSEIADETSGYRLELDVEADLPIIGIAAQAPDEEGALRLANGAAQGLRRYIQERARPNPSGRTVLVRPLGNAIGRTVGGPTGVVAAGAAFAVTLVVCCLLILAVSSVARRWREDEQPPPLPELAHVSSPDPADPGSARVAAQRGVHAG